MGRMLILAGVALVVVGVVLVLGERLPIRLGRLPGDIEVKGKGGTFYFPVATCLLLSLVASLVLWLFSRR
jgi:hypothetical protein